MWCSTTMIVSDVQPDSIVPFLFQGRVASTSNSYKNLFIWMPHQQMLTLIMPARFLQNQTCIQASCCSGGIWWPFDTSPLNLDKYWSARGQLAVVINVASLRANIPKKHDYMVVSVTNVVLKLTSSNHHGVCIFHWDVISFDQSQSEPAPQKRECHDATTLCQNVKTQLAFPHNMKAGHL